MKGVQPSVHQEEKWEGSSQEARRALLRKHFLRRALPLLQLPECLNVPGSVA